MLPGGNRCGLMFHRRSSRQSNIGTAWCDIGRAAACPSSPARMRMPNWAAFRPISSNITIEPPTIMLEVGIVAAVDRSAARRGERIQRLAPGEGLAGSILKHREVKHNGGIR